MHQISDSEYLYPNLALMPIDMHSYDDLEAVCEEHLNFRF